MSGAATRRAVVLVGGPAKPYSRSLRIARTLVEAGYEVEIAAIVADGAPDVEHEGPIVVRRYAPGGPFRRWATAHAVAGVAPARDAAGHAGDAEPKAAAEAKAGPGPRAAAGPKAADTKAPADAGRLPSTGPIGAVIGLGRRVRRVYRNFMPWAFWPVSVRGWWRTLGRELAPADLYHACGTLTIAAALDARRRDRRAGRRSVVVYDVIDNTFEGNNVLRMPRRVRRYHAERERRWATEADARTAVNDALAARVAERWSVPPPVVVPNWPEAVAPEVLASNRIRETLGLPADQRIVLFQGRLSPNLGLDEVAEAVLRLERTSLVLLGFGRLLDRMRARDAEPRYAGRHFTLPAVHPDELAAWTASADVSMVTLPPVSRNQRESTPNKFWESLLVGTPVVLGPGLDLMAGIVADAGAGVVARSLAPDDLAAAIREVLDVDPAERDARRRRVAGVAAARYSWPVAADRYRALLATLGDPGR